jgi:hypothetical protein
VGGKARRWLKVAAKIVIIAVAGTVVWRVWQSPHRDDLSTFGAFVVAIVALAVSVPGFLPKNWPWVDSGQVRTPDELADSLADAVKIQWSRAATERRLLQPEPIPVRWEQPSQPVAGPVSAAVKSQRFPPLPGLDAVGEGRLRQGGMRDLHAVYGGLGSGRMVIVGAPGSGKNGAAVLLVLAALRHREQVPEKDRPLVPVPVMFTLHGWDPNTQRVQDWLAARLHETYRLFVGKRGTAGAAALIRTGKVAVILDGLNEIPEKLRPVALQALNEQEADLRVVVLGRSDETATAARKKFLVGAVGLELQDIDPEVAADYLTSVQLDPAPRGWRELTDRLRQAADSPIAKALSSPLTLTLVRDTYREGDDVRELLNVCDATDHGISREDIEDHLLDRVLPVAYAPHPGKKKPPKLKAAQRALSHIAARMNQDTTRDLAWWQIPAWASAAPRVIAPYLLAGAVGLAAGLVSGLISGHVIGLRVGLLVGLSGFVGGLSMSRADRASPRSPVASWRHLQAYGLMVGLGLGLGLGPWIVFGLRFGFGYTGGVVGLVVVGLGTALVVGLVYPGETWAASLALLNLPSAGTPLFASCGSSKMPASAMSCARSDPSTSFATLGCRIASPNRRIRRTRNGRPSGPSRPQRPLGETATGSPRPHCWA